MTLKPKPLVTSILLVNLAYPHGKPQAFLPGGLLNLGSRLLTRGITVGLKDLNFHEVTLAECQNYAAVGITLIGSAMIPQAYKVFRHLKAEGYSGRLLLGGPLVATLTDEDVADLTKELPGVECIRTDVDLMGVFGPGLMAKQAVNMVPMLEKLATEDPTLLIRYLSNEFCLYTSSGCVYKCAFCAAPENGHNQQGARERYRAIEPMEAEIRWICSFLAEHTEVKTLRMYLSNLDAFQTFPQLIAVLETVNRVCAEFGMKPLMRCLATPHFVFINLKKGPEVGQMVRSLGLYEAGIGVDGLGPKYWKATNKVQNKMPEVLQAMLLLKEADIICELLMVQGGRVDTFWMMFRSYLFCVWYACKGFTTRTYMAKEPPGSQFWRELHHAERQRYWQDPVLFKMLDFAMNAGELTHPNWWKRVTSNLFFNLTVRTLQPFGRCTTYPLHALPLDPKKRPQVEAYNSRIPFDK